MGKHPQDELDKDRRKRLETLEAGWNGTGGFGSDSLGLSDLRLLLEHFAPVQALIRTIATASPDEAPVMAAAQDKDGTAVPASTRPELEQALARCTRAEKDLTQCTALTRQLVQERDEARQAHDALAARLQQVQEQLARCQAELARPRPVSPALALLRSDSELARQLGLDGLSSDDQAAQVHTVAVLAQRDNLERLWSLLKERCEDQGRQASEAELALLDSALGWYNHNWQARPWQFTHALPGAGYDYEQHLRSRHTATGETLGAQWMPGIADGSGRTVCKALVTTL